MQRGRLGIVREVSRGAAAAPGASGPGTGGNGLRRADGWGRGNGWRGRGDCRLHAVRWRSCSRRRAGCGRRNGGGRGPAVPRSRGPGLLAKKPRGRSVRQDTRSRRACPRVGHGSGGRGRHPWNESAGSLGAGSGARNGNRLSGPRPWPASRKALARAIPCLPPLRSLRERKAEAGRRTGGDRRPRTPRKPVDSVLRTGLPAGPKRRSTPTSRRQVPAPSLGCFRPGWRIGQRAWGVRAVRRRAASTASGAACRKGLRRGGRASCRWATRSPSLRKWGRRRPASSEKGS